MRVLFDNQCFHFIGPGGVSRYFAEVIGRFGASDGHEAVVQPHPLLASLLAGGEPDRGLDLPGVRRLRLAWNRWRNRRFVRGRLEAGDVDLFLPTYFHPYFLPHVGDHPFVIVVHDMISERRRPDSSESRAKARILPRAAR